MKEQRGLTLFLTLSVVVMIVLVGVVMVKAVKSAPIYINSFDDCLRAGNKILETSPAQCQTLDGKVFTQEVSSGADLN